MNKKHWFHIALFVVLTQNICAQETFPETIEAEEFFEEEILTQYDIERDSINSTLVPISTEQLQSKKFDDDFRSHYSGSAFQYEKREENGFLARLRNMWQRFLDFFKLEKNSNANIVMDEIINILLAIGLIIGLGFLIYYLNQKGFIRLFSKKEAQVINEKYIEENIEKVDFAVLTHQAKQDNDLRKAVRYYYLWLLKNWSQYEFISYEPNKTTNEYLAELENISNKTAFQYVSYIYDNIWYGYHEISENDFAKIEQQFVQLINKTA